MRTELESLQHEIAALKSKNLELDLQAKALALKVQTLETDLNQIYGLVNSISDAIYLTDENLAIKWANRSFLEKNESESLSQIPGGRHIELEGRVAILQAQGEDENILKSGEGIVNKLESQPGIGESTIWTMTTKIPLKDALGKVTGIGGITKDISAYKKAEEALAREAALVNDLLENSPDLVYFKDRESRFTWINSAFVKLVGVQHKSELIGKSDFDLFSPEHAKEAREDELTIMATSRPIINKLEVDNYADGSRRLVYSTKVPIHDGKGNVIGTGGISRDVTALKKAEEALAQESNLLNAMLDNIPDAIYFKDLQSRFVRVSRSFHLNGLNKSEDAIGKTDFDFFSKSYAQVSYTDEQEIFRTGNPILDKVELETFDNNRPSLWVSTTKVPIYDQERNITGIVGISRDVTERMVAQEEIRKATKELEVRVQERTSALVQEIKEHLRTEKALSEGEKKLQEANARLESRVGQLHFLNSAAHKLAHFPHRKELLPAIVETFVRSHPGIEAAICEMGNAGYECGATSSRLTEPEHRKACASLLASQGLVLLSSPQIISNRQQHLELGKIEVPGMQTYPVYVAIPLVVEENSLAVVQIFAPSSFLIWYEQENVIMNTLAAQAAISLSNANNFLELDKKARLAGELEVAQAIQRRFTPQGKPPIPRINLKGLYFPAYEVGGDYLDYFQTDKGHWVVVIADVSGKGIPAALVMTMLRSTFRAEARYEYTAKQLLCAVNDLMIKDMDDKSFVTALCLIIDQDGKTMSYARAGHPPLLVQRGGSGVAPISLSLKGLALGMVAGKEFESRMDEMTLDLTLGDRYLIFTDGLLDAMDMDRGFYGMERLLKIITNDIPLDPEKVLKNILDDIRVFTRNEPYHDDLTMLAMEVTG